MQTDDKQGVEPDSGNSFRDRLVLTVVPRLKQYGPYACLLVFLIVSGYFGWKQWAENLESRQVALKRKSQVERFINKTFRVGRQTGQDYLYQSISG